MRSSNKFDDLICIGKIVGAHGIQGVIRVHSYAQSEACFTRPDGFTRVDTRGIASPCQALWVQPHKNGLRLALKDVTTRAQAEALAGCELFIPRDSLPPLEDAQTNYWIDLIGLTVYDCQDACLGEITDIIQTGANDVYVVKTTVDCPVKEILLPAIASVVLEVDLARGIMRVALPEGLI